MRRIHLQTIAALICLFLATAAHAQQSQDIAAVPKTTAVLNTGAVPSTGAIPNVVRFSGSFRPSNGQPAQPVESVTLSVYRDQTGGTALWQETQNVAVDSEGKYSLLMGATQNDGVPLDLLSAGEPRWLGVQLNRPGEPEQPRVLMASVPYALKSVDAETLGGKPASAYLLAPLGTNVSGTTLASGGLSTSSAGTSLRASSNTTGPATSTTVGATTSGVKPRTISGTQNFFPYFIDGSNDLGNSVMQQANGNVGIGTVPGAGAPTIPSLDLRTFPFAQVGMAQTTDYLSFFSSDQFGPAIYWNPGKDMRFGKGGAGLYNAFGFTEQMRIQSATGNVGIGTQSPGSKLDVAGNINMGGSLLLQGYPVLAVPGSMSSENLALGFQALQNDVPTVGLGTPGNANTAIGYEALVYNTTGLYNTAVGAWAGSGTDSSQNSYAGTYIGYGAGPGIDGLSYAAAIGAGAVVSQSHALILGSTGSFAVTVGIGTATPFSDYALDVEATTQASIDSGVVVNANGGNLYLGMTNGVHKFRVSNTGVAYADGGFQSSGADFAESIEVTGDKSRYEPGDVLVIQRGAHRRMTLSSAPYSTLVAGIYSTKPGMLATPHSIDDNLDGEVPLAMVGIVPCKVTAENGVIHEGDLLVTSSRPGYAMKGKDRKRMLGAVVGKALEPLPKGTGVIQVLVTLQ